MHGTRGMSCVEHKECLAWNTRNGSHGKKGMSCLEHTKCLAWNTGNVLFGSQGMSCVERKECLAWNTGSVLLGTQGISCLKHRACPALHTKTRCQKLSGAQFHAQEQNRHGQVVPNCFRFGRSVHQGRSSGCCGHSCSGAATRLWRRQSLSQLGLWHFRVVQSFA